MQKSASDAGFKVACFPSNLSKNTSKILQQPMISIKISMKTESFHLKACISKRNDVKTIKNKQQKAW
jgi:hypothetical protein